MDAMIKQQQDQILFKQKIIDELLILQNKIKEEIKQVRLSRKDLEDKLFRLQEVKMKTKMQMAALSDQVGDREKQLTQRRKEIADLKAEQERL